MMFSGVEPCVIFQTRNILPSIHKNAVPSSPHIYQYVWRCYCGGGGGGTTRPLPRDGGAEEFRGDPTVKPHPKVWTIGKE